MARPRTSFGARVYATGNLAVLVNKSWNCNANVNLDLVKVTMWTIDVDSVVFNTGCTGRIGRVEVDTWTGDGVKVTNASTNAAHDLVVESPAGRPASTRVLGRSPGRLARRWAGRASRIRELRLGRAANMADAVRLGRRERGLRRRQGCALVPT